MKRIKPQRLLEENEIPMKTIFPRNTRKFLSLPKSPIKLSIG